MKDVSACFEIPTMISSMWRSLLRVLSPLFLLLAFAANAQAANSATYVSQSVPTTMPAGSTQTVTVTMANNGTTTWTTAGQYSLGSQNPENNMTWGGRINPPGSIAPGAQASFTFQITAPTTQGTYNFQWRMLQENIEWFGPFTPNVAIVVTAPVNGSQVIAKSVPASMTQGQTYPVSVTMKNTGGTTWPAGTAYNLGSTNPYDTMIWGLKRVPLNSAVAPGQQYTFSFNVVAPAPGSYTMGWGMVQEFVEWFGPTSSSSVSVGGGTQVPTISVSRTPSPMIAGQSYTLNWSSSNATSISRVCTSTGTGYTVNDAPALQGPTTGTANAAWIGYPSSCVWKATGAGGATATFNETMTTNAAPTGTVVTYIHTDGLGSPVARTNSSGGLVSRTRYEPYGLTASGAVPTLGFTGHVNDADTGLVYMQQRYYDPVAGRFLSIDQVATDANTGGSFNRYAYANNSPYKYIDPDGRDPNEAYRPLLFRLTTFEGAKQGTTISQATANGAVARDAGAPLIAAADHLVAHSGEIISAIGQIKSGGRGVGPVSISNKVRPIEGAVGPHSAIKRGPDGTITNTATYTPNPKNPTGFDEVKRVDVTGTSHTNTDGTKVPTPHVHEAGVKNVRPANPTELPKP